MMRILSYWLAVARAMEMRDMLPLMMMVTARSIEQK